MPVRRRRNKRKPRPPDQIGDPCLAEVELPPGWEFERFAPCDRCGYEGNLDRFIAERPPRE